ncbi:hypothetical protein K501DRAFT_285892 [Backusella circina FSU 941]|nr:hypothetical protein K501DRAFT_285892 [Backusella circina FSU 941]
MDSQPLKLADVHLSSFRHWSLKEPRKHLLNIRAVDDDKDLSTSDREDLDISRDPSAETTWITCTSNFGVTDSVSGEHILSIDQINSLGYDCRERPYMTVLMIVTIVIFLILRKSSYINKWVENYDIQLKEQAALSEEEEGLMERVF